MVMDKIVDGRNMAANEYTATADPSIDGRCTRHHSNHRLEEIFKVR